MKPHEIEHESFRLIEELVDYKELINSGKFTEDEWNVVRRIVHATGDPAIVDSIEFSKNFISAAKTALVNKEPIICDVKMLMAGISTKVKLMSIDALCYIDDPQVIKESKELGETRSRRAVMKAVNEYPLGIYAIGNAPTALLALMELMKAGIAKPSVIIGMPVGFVMAAESKQMLSDLAKTRDVEYITCLGFKGGSPMVAATINAILSTP